MQDYLTRRVFLNALKVDTLIGIYEQEYIDKQPVLISLSMEVLADAGSIIPVFVPPKWEEDAEMRAIVCYDSLSKLMRKMVTSKHYGLIETLAEDIADAVLSDKRILSVTVKIEKPDAITDAASAGVEITRQQN